MAPTTPSAGSAARQRLGQPVDRPRTRRAMRSATWTGVRAVPPGRRVAPGRARAAGVSDPGTPGAGVDEAGLERRGHRAAGARTTTMWSAPVAWPSSSTMASTIASGETERDRPVRIRANDSASSRRRASSAATAAAWTAAAPSAGDARGASISQSRTAAVGQQEPQGGDDDEPQEGAGRRPTRTAGSRRSDGIGGRRGGAGGVRSRRRVQDGGPGACASTRYVGTMAVTGRYFRPVAPAARRAAVSPPRSRPSWPPARFTW